jgi:outer membrane protein assembly factor BamB
MKSASLTTGVIAVCAALLGVGAARAQDWPQWRGPNRDGKATGFTAPKTWPKELMEKWKVKVGEGVATPALVGDKLYVFSRESGSEVIRCLDAGTGKEVWKDSYEARGVTGPASGFSGPRCSPAVADGKVVTLGVHGKLSCYDAASGKKLWSKDDVKGEPRFAVASSPIIVDGLCIAQLGGESGGGIVAYELATGNEKWKWTGDGPAYSSPVLLTLGDTKAIIAMTAKNIVGVNVADGKLLWETSFPAGGGQVYNAATPMVDGQTVLYGGNGGRGTRAVKIDKKDAAFEGKELWTNKDNSVKYNTPVIKSGLVYALSDRDSIFCINAETGTTAWKSSAVGPGGRQAGYGSIVEAGPVLLALTPKGELIVFEPSDKEFKQIASYKVGTDTYAYPILSGNRVFMKDRDSVILWTIE